MVCPLLKIARDSLDVKSRIAGKPSSECLEQECAWWLEHSKRCSIPIMALNLDVIGDYAEYKSLAA